MKKIVLLVLISILISCQNGIPSNYKYSEEETSQFLDEITKNAKASITDLTERDQQPTAEFGIITRYPLAANRLKEFKEHHGTLVNRDDDIAEFATYTFKSYELTNERNEQLHFVANSDAVYLQELALWEYNGVLCQNLGIMIKLDKKFNTLKGSVTIEFIMPGNFKKEVKIPVAISVKDKIPE